MSNSIAVNKNSDTRAWICAILLFVISYPKWFWVNVNIPTIASVLLLLVAFNDISNNKNGRIAGIVALLCQFVILYVNTSVTTPRFNLIGFSLLVIKWLGFSTLFLCSTCFWKKCVDCFVKLLAILLVVAIIEHVMVGLLGLRTVSPSYAECPNNPHRGYKVFLFTVYLEGSFDNINNRFYAFYDEPGVLGNIIMVLLYIQRFNLKKWYNIVFLISGLLSLSLAFYIALIVYYVLFGKLRTKIGFLVIGGILMYYFYGNEYINNMVFERLTFEEDGSLAGYNRENIGFSYWIYEIDWKDYLFWGYQPSNAVPYAASWKWAFALYGIIPSIIYLLVISIQYAKQVLQIKDVLLGYILMVIIWIQRPCVHWYLYVFLIVIPFIYLSRDTNQNNKELCYDNNR